MLVPVTNRAPLSVLNETCGEYDLGPAPEVSPLPPHTKFTNKKIKKERKKEEKIPDLRCTEIAGFVPAVRGRKIAKLRIPGA